MLHTPGIRDTYPLLLLQPPRNKRKKACTIIIIIIIIISTPFTQHSLTPSDVAHKPTPLHIAYCLLPMDTSSRCTAGSMVLHPTSLCPPYSPTPSTQPFQHLFGIEFIVDDDVHVRPFSSFEFAACLSLGSELTYSLSRHDFTACMDAGIPDITSAWLFDQVHDKLRNICNSNTDVFDPSTQQPSVLMLVISQNSISVRMPTTQQWTECTNKDVELTLIKSMISDPARTTKANRT